MLQESYFNVEAAKAEIQTVQLRAFGEVLVQIRDGLDAALCRGD